MCCLYVTRPRSLARPCTAPTTTPYQSWTHCWPVATLDNSILFQELQYTSLNDLIIGKIIFEKKPDRSSEIFIWTVNWFTWIFNSIMENLLTFVFFSRSWRAAKSLQKHCGRKFAASFICRRFVRWVNPSHTIVIWEKLDFSLELKHDKLVCC